MGFQKKLAVLAIFVATFAVALPSAKPVSIYLTQVMHNSRKAEADRLFQLGEQQLKSNQPKAALESFQKALPIYQQLQERLAEGHTYRSIGNAYFFLKGFSQALVYQKKALDIAKEIKNPDLEARTLINLGAINSAQGNMSAVIDFFIQGLAIAQSSQNNEMVQTGLSSVKMFIDIWKKNLINIRENKDKRKEVDVLVSLGKAYAVVGENSKAIASFEQASVVARELKDIQLGATIQQNQGQVLVSITNSYLQRKDFITAIQYSQELIAIARKIKNPQLEVGGLGFLASAYMGRSNLQASIKLREEQQKIFEKYEAPWVELLHGREQVLLCDNYRLLNEYTKAVGCYQNGISISQKYQKNQNSQIQVSNRIAEFLHLLGLGIAYQQTNQNQKSIQILESAHAIYKELKNNSYFSSKERETSLFQFLGQNYHTIGDTQKAIEYFQQQLSSASGNIIEQGNAHINLGMAHFAQNKYDVSLDYFDKVLKIAQDNKNPLLEIQAYRTLASSYAFIGNVDMTIENEEKALIKIAQNSSNCFKQNQNNSVSQPTQDFFSQQLEIVQCKSIQQNKVQSLTHLGRLYVSPTSEKYDFNVGIKYINQGLELARKLKLADEEATALRHLGSANSGQRNWKTAIKYYEQALALERETIDANNSLQWNSKADLLQTLAIQYAASGNLDKAFQIQRDAESLLQKNPDSNPHGLAISRSQTGFLYFLAKDNKKAEKLLSEAIDKYESILDSGIGTQDANRISFFDSYLSSYQRLVEVLIAQNRNEDALEISERGRARILAQLLANSSIDSKSRDLKTQTPKISLTQIKQIAKQQNATLVHYQIVYDPLRIIPPSGKNKQPQIPATKILIWVVQPNGKITFHESESELTQLLQSNTSLENIIQDTLVSIRENATKTRGSNQLTLKKGDRVKIKGDHLGDPAWIVEAVNNDTIFLRRPPGKTSEFPITDVLEKVGGEGSQSSANARNIKLQRLYRLLIKPIAEELPKQPDARVIFVPQQELFAVPFPALQDSQGKYLIEKHTIITSPSIQVLQLTHQKSQQVSSFEREILLVGNPTMPKLINTFGKLEQLASLTNAEAEVKAIASLFQSKPKPLIGKEATKNVILAMFPNTRIIHFATHGILNDKRGLQSAIALAPDGNDSGFLTAEEIFKSKLKLNAELVVISACHTGQGRITGDGVIGLSRSLMNAGVPSMVVTLWDIPDESTTPLMTEFYRNLQKNKLDKAKSLQKAMLTMIENGFSPNDWAAFNLIGNAE